MKKAINKEMSKVETIAIGREFGRFWPNLWWGQRSLLSIHSRGTYFSSAVLRIRNRWIDNLIKGVKSKPPGFRVVFGSLSVLPENTCLFISPVGDVGTLRLHSGYIHAHAPYAAQHTLYTPMHPTLLNIPHTHLCTLCCSTTHRWTWKPLWGLPSFKVWKKRKE